MSTRYGRSRCGGPTPRLPLGEGKVDTEFLYFNAVCIYGAQLSCAERTVKGSRVTASLNNSLRTGDINKHQLQPSARISNDLKDVVKKADYLYILPRHLQISTNCDSAIAQGCPHCSLFLMMKSVSSVWWNATPWNSYNPPTLL